MMIYAYLSKVNAEYPLLMAPFDVLPRVGDIIEFEFAAHDGDKWDRESWDDRQKINDHSWKVVSVSHGIRQNSIDKWGSHSITLFVKRVQE